MAASAAAPLAAATAEAEANRRIDNAAMPAPDREKLYAIGHYYTPQYKDDEYHLDDLVRGDEDAAAAIERESKSMFADEKRGIFKREVEGVFPQGDRYLAVCCEWDNDEWMPKHLLDVPPKLRVCSEEYSLAGEFQSREDAFAGAIEGNQKEVETEHADPERYSRYWYIVVQVGEPFRLNLWSVDMHGEVGHHNHLVDRPVRLVRPTAAEFERFAPLPLKWDDMTDGEEVAS